MIKSRYTDDELNFCLGFNCKFNNINSLRLDGKYNDEDVLDGVIRMKPISEDRTNVAYVSLFGAPQMGYSILRVIAIPIYDIVKNKRLFGLIK